MMHMPFECHRHMWPAFRRAQSSIYELQVLLHSSRQGRIALAKSCFCVAMCCVGMTGCSGETERSTATTVSSQHQQQSLSVAEQDSPTLTRAATPPLLTEFAPPDDAQARNLFEILASPSTRLEDWDQTHQELLELGESTVRVLAEKLKQGTAVERELAATTLALLGPDAVLARNELLQALEDDSLFVQANAAAALVQLPDGAGQAIPTLARLLSADDPQLRQLAAVNLNAAGAATAGHLDSLKLALSQENTVEVLTPVVELLGRIGKPAEAALPELRKIAFEQSGELQAAASSAIHLIQDEADSP